MTRTVTGQLQDRGFRSRYAEPMFRLRHQVFRERLGWDVESHNGLEFDSFDDDDTVYQVVTDGDTVTGCWRLRPTLSPTMLHRVFPELIAGEPPEPQSNTWEISRFTTTNSAYVNSQAGFGQSAIELMNAALDFADANGIDRYLMVTSTPLERIGRRLGMPTRRLGSPRRIGKVTAVALDLQLNTECRRLIRGMHEMLNLLQAA